MAHDEFTAGVPGRQRDEQRGEHAGCFFGVAVADEEAALVVHQQLVELGHHLRRNAQAAGHLRHDGLQIARPVLALDVNPLRADLPSAPNLGVDQRLCAAAKRRALGHGNELFGLHGQQRQRHRPDAVDLQPRPMQRHRAGGMKVTGAANRAQQRGQVVGK